MKKLFILIALIPALSFGQAKKDLKIGLVLSGGGAKCMAQIGALKVIEEAGIKLDYIGGTSMGAIIGAMYSLGYSADEIEFYLRQVNWDALMENEVPRNRLSFFDRKSDDRYFLSFPLTKNGIEVPKGINYAQYILKELSSITQQSFPYQSFGDLPIPFFCLATNLETGRAKVFEDGRLIDALRASSAFPSLFTPYQIEDSLYIDGGVVLNYPVRIMKEKDVDVIIGVDMQDYLNKREDLNSAIRVLEQTTGFLNSRNQAESEALTDLLIAPKIPEAGINSFELFDSIVAEGEREARKHWKALKELAAADPLKEGAKEKALPLREFYVHHIEVNGLESLTKNYVLGKLRLKEGSTCQLEKLEAGLDQLYGSRYFETVDYTMAKADSGYVLSINLKEQNFYQSFKLGLNYNDDYGAALLLNYTNRKLLFKNSRLSVDLALGDMPRGELNYFVDRGYIPTLGIKLRSYRFRYQNFRNRQPINEKIYQDYSLDLFIQSTLRDAYAIGGGIQLEDIDITQDFETNISEDLNQGFINYYGYIDFDSFDDANFPSHGFQLNAQYRIIAERQGFENFLEPSSVFDLSYRQAISLNSKWTVLTKLYGATTIGPNLSRPYQIHFGSLGQAYINYIQPFIGYRFMELIGRNALMLRADVNYEIYKDHFLQFKANFGKMEPTLNALFISDILLDGYSLGYTYNSLIGPLEFNLAGSTNHRDIYAYIRLGFWF